MSIILSSREKKIITSILSSSSGVTLKEISEEIGVSRRTVLREMKSVYDWFDKQGFPIERQSSKGLSLDITEDQKTQLRAELSGEMIMHHYNKKERTLYIVTELLQSKDALKLSYFSTVLDVSEASISSDLNHVETWLESYNLVLNRKQGYGIEVLGTERDKRRALVKIIYETLDSSQLLDAVQRKIGMNDKVKVTSRIRLNLLNMIDVATITIIEKAIINAEKEIGFKFAESSYTALAVHLALACKRIVNGETINVKDDVMTEIRTYAEYNIAAKLIKSLEKELNINIPDDEIAYVTLHLKGARYKNGMIDTSILKFNEMIISNYQLTHMVNKMINIASKESGYNLKEVESLLIGLIDHLRPVISRIQMDLDIRNPLLEKIKTEYADIFEISKKCSKILEDELKVVLPESEIGYIAIHIGSAIEQLKNKSDASHHTYNVVVTCITGIGTSKMLAERIKKEFSNINIVEVFSTTSVKNEFLQRHEIDLILSTVPHKNDIVPVLSVNPLLLEQDIKKINQKLTSLTVFRKNKVEDKEEDFYDMLLVVREYSDAILDVLDNMIVKSNLKCFNYTDLLYTVAESISDDPKTLYKEIIEREKVNKVVFNDEYVSFLHTRSDVVKHLYVGIYRNKNMIFDEMYHYDTVLVLIAPKNIKQYKLEILGEISSKVVSEDNFLRDLRHDTESELYRKVQNFLKKFFNKKFKRR